VHSGRGCGVSPKSVPAADRVDGDGAPLRVLRLCSVFEPPDEALTGRGVRFDPVGGMQSHTGQLTRALDRRGVRQAVVTHRPPGAPRQQRIGEHAVIHRFGLPVARARQFYSAAGGRAALRLASDVDLVHAHQGEDLAVLPIALAAARRAGLALVVTVHCSLRHTFTAPGPRGLLLERLGGTIEGAVCRRADALIALTPRLAERLEADGFEPERIHVIPSGVTASAAVAGDAPDRFADVGRPRIVYVGRLAAAKGVDTLVAAAARLRTPGAHVLLVGDGPARSSLERAIRRHRLGDRVRIAGFMPHREIPAVLAHADVFCLPSRYEELGTALLEAMQAGVPIVASDTGGIPAVVGSAARLVAPGDAAALAGALDALLADRQQAGRLVAIARERVRACDWERLADRVLDVYGLALETSAHRPADRLLQRTADAEPGQHVP
jgi:glycogen(starch) synthase